MEKEKKFKEELENNSLTINSSGSIEIEIKEMRFRRLMKEKQFVYDSLSDEEYFEDIEDYYYIKPDSNFLHYFDMLLLILSIYAIVFSPIDFAFNINQIENYITKSFFVEFIVDLFFLIDFFIGFFIAYYNFEEQLISQHRMIIKHYFKGWFWINLISGIPINSFFNVIDYYRMKNNIIYTNISYLIDIFELLRLLRLLKLFKTFKNNTFIRRMSIKISRLDNLIIKWFTLYMFLFIFFVSVHLLSCVYIFLSQLSHPNWIYINNLEIKNKFEVYIASLYFICATIFTIGYGDIVSVSLYERFFNLILLVVGIMIYSYAVSALSNYVQSVDSKTLEYRNKIEILEEIRINHEKMPQNLIEKISKFLLYKLYHGKKDTNDIIDNLPLLLKNKLIMEMYKDTINNFIFFKNFHNSDFVIRVILAFKSIQASKNERLVNEGDYIEEIIFVKKGKLSLEIPIPIIIKKETIQKIQTIRHSRASLKFNLTKGIIPVQTLNNNIIPNEIEAPTQEEIKEIKTLRNFNDEINKRQYFKIIEIRKNEHFGDILMFLNKRSPLSVRVKSRNCELFLLKKTEAVQISMDFPRIWRKIIKKSLFNMEQIERLINKTLKFFYIRNEGNQTLINNNNYFRIDPSKGNRLFNETNIINSLKNLNEQSELKSIPSEEINEENDEEEEEEEEEEENSSINAKKISNIKTIIKEEDEDSSLESKSIKSEKSIITVKGSNIEKKLKSKKSIESNKSIKNEKNSQIEESFKTKTSLKIGKTQNNNNSSENNLSNNNSIDNLEKGKTYKITEISSDNDKKSNSSSNSKITVITNPKNNFFDNLLDCSIRDRKTLISSNLQYSTDEINNESLPFEEPITINTSEKISSDLLPKEIYKCSKLYDCIILNHNENFDFSKKKNSNNILMLLKNTKNNNNNYYSNNNNNELKDKIIIIKSSFKSLYIQNIENFTIKGKKKDNFKLYCEEFKKDINENNHKINKTYISKSDTSPNSTETKIKKTKTLIKKSNNIFQDKSTSPTNNHSSIKKRLSKIILLPNNSFQEESENSEVDIPYSLKQSFKKQKTLNEIEQNEKNRKFEKQNNEIDNIISIKNSENLIKESIISNKKNTLDIIKSNIEKNSLNLNNPKYFYSKYFSSVIHENNPKNEFRKRLKNLAKIIKNNKKEFNKEEEINIIKGKT